ncbi:vitamin B12 transporter BtuB [mine drainage metagenome]|uniref:Vitamin B12 transporter BtuB n=1 Tax=mine drainage metagenome TaxID=410659 RepID=A0A1J5PV43_9ZZZZ
MRNHYSGIYFTDRLAPMSWLDVSAGGRFERARIDMTDRLGGTLGGNHGFSRFSPSVGLDLHPTNRAAYYLRYAEGMRVPMPVELTCASPDAPCTLPNVLVADPELQPVIARTAQAGAVWRLGGLRLHAEYTHTRLSNALQFISLANMTQGYFTNIPQELFRTLTLDVSGATARWYWSASLSRTVATYESAFLEPSPSNSTADASGNVQVRPGDRLPNIPTWSVKLLAQYQPTERWQLHGAVIAYSARYAQGDENNADRHGQVPGYAVVNLGAQYKVDRHWRLTLSVHNLFDRVYTDFGQLGVNEFTSAGRSFSSDPAAWQNTLFVAPGAPRGIWLGVSYSWT